MALNQYTPIVPGPPPQYQLFARQIAVPVTANKVVSSREWYIAKILLGIASIITALAVLGIGGGLAGMFPTSNAFRDIALSFPPVGCSQYQPQHVEADNY